jgi:very-short-patch-repair endonuclease
MRRAPTDAERRLWLLLRSQRLVDLKFRRQVPIGTFIADFVCQAERLVVEVDGGQHAESGSDTERDQWFKRAGYKVLRVWNNDVLKNPNGVLEFILSSIANGAR